MTEIVIQGIGGRMGHVLCDMIAQREDCCVVAGIDVKDGEQNGIPVYDSLEKLNGKGDVVIDFSSPAAVEKALPYCEAHKLPIVGSLRPGRRTADRGAAPSQQVGCSQRHRSDAGRCHQRAE